MSLLQNLNKKSMTIAATKLSFRLQIISCHSGLQHCSETQKKCGKRFANGLQT